MESQTGLSDLRGIRAELAHQAEKTALQEKARDIECVRRDYEVWPLDFMHDRLVDRRPFRLLNVIDDFNR
jgi:putative transposase